MPTLRIQFSNSVTAHMGPHSRSTHCPRFAVISRPLRMEGARECRVHGAPAVSCASTTKKTHTSIQVHRNHPASPHAMALRLMTCSPRRTGWMTPSPAKLPSPTWHMRRHAGTTRFCRPQESALVSCTSRGHRSPPRVFDVRETPLCLGRDGENIGRILIPKNGNIFA